MTGHDEALCLGPDICGGCAPRPPRRATPRDAAMGLPAPAPGSCSNADHERLKLDDARWYSSTTVAYYDKGPDGIIEARNCRRCGSTLGRFMRGQLVLL